LHPRAPRDHAPPAPSLFRTVERRICCTARHNLSISGCSVTHIAYGHGAGDRPKTLRELVDVAALYDWPGGYCTKFGCDLAGNECAGGGRCMDLGVHVCVQPCTVGAEATQPYVIGATGHGEGCRDTYACIWNGTDGAGVPNNGGCIPGEYNDIAVNNIGAGCAGMDSDSMCYSPFGLGRCFDADAWFEEGPFPSSGYCTMVGCAAPGLPTDVCGIGNQCVSLGGDTTICAKGCTLPDDCVAGYGCVDFDGMETTPKVCFPACAGAADCRATERCDIPSGEMIGRCVTM